MNQRGQPVTDLNPSQFVATYRGKPPKILSATPSPGPRRVFILIDASGSMEPTHQVDFDVTDELLDQLPAGTEIAAAAFAREITAAAPFTKDKESVRKELHSFRDNKKLTKSLKGTTALLEAINRSASVFGTPQMGDVLYVISDGDDNESEIKWRTLDEELLQRGVRVFTFRIRWVAAGLIAGSESTFPEIVTSTGGMAIVVPLNGLRYEQQSLALPLRDANGKKLHIAIEIDLQARLMLNLNKMQLELPEPPRGKREIELRLVQKSPDLFLVYQHTLPACYPDLTAR